MKLEISDFDGNLLPNRSKVGMSVNGLKCNFHMPKALERKFDRNDEEMAQGLPPGAPRAAFAVDEYPRCPNSWMHGSSTASSYFVPVKAGDGIWLDMCENEQHTHHVAAVISIQGVNPLTGVKTDPVRLEQYKTKCPVHDVEFKQDLFCEKCEHKWPPQNYISTNNGSPFWLDGFMAEDGIVRQWILTEEEVKGVAAQIIKQERVPAIGIAFYLSKEPKPVAPVNITRGASSAIYGASNIKTKGLGPSGSSGGSLGWTSLTDCDTKISNNYSDGGVYTCSTGSNLPEMVAATGSSFSYDPLSSQDDFYIPEPMKSITIEKEEKTSGGIRTPDSNKIGRKKRSRSEPKGRSATPVKVTDTTPLKEEEIKKLEIGAGAKINQRIFRDPQNLDFWQDQPAGFIYISYCDEATAKKIIEAGKREEKPEGFLTNLNLAK